MCQVASNGLERQLAQPNEEEEIHRYFTYTEAIAQNPTMWFFPHLADDKGHEKLLNEIKGVESANYKLRCLVWVNFPLAYTQASFILNSPLAPLEYLNFCKKHYLGGVVGLRDLIRVFADWQPIHSASVRVAVPCHMEQ